MAILAMRDILLLCVCTVIYCVYRYRHKSLVLPPGPRRWPIVGSALSIPFKSASVVYKELGEKLGSKLVYYDVFGNPYIIINDFQTARELLEKRSAVYSSRPQLRMLTDVMGIKTLFGCMPYGEEWRNHRRIFTQHFSLQDVDMIHDRAIEFARKGLLPNILESPQDIFEHLRSYIGGLSLSLTYGIPIQRNDDPLIKFSAEALDAANITAAPGKYLVNLIPSLQHVPKWMPGAGFKRIAHKIRDQLIELTEGPYEAALMRMNDGTAKPSFVSESLRRHQERPDYEAQALCVKQIGLQIFNVAFEATITPAETFILAMLVYPDVQRKAQQEIDLIVGESRLPDSQDLPNLPYLSAIIKEILRWNPVVPLGVPHLVTEDDVYEGFTIPKGCTLQANSYAMLHDEQLFPNPKVFDPERFLKEGILNTHIPDPEVFATFGFGRRVCPGSHVGLAMLYIAAVSILSMYDVVPTLDAEGKPIKVVPEFKADAVASAPLPFKCRLIPRKGKDVESLIKEYMGHESI